LAGSALKVAKQLLKSEAFLKNRAQSIKNKDGIKRAANAALFML
jgi:hypothetical protein